MKTWSLYFRAPTAPALDRVTSAISGWLAAPVTVTASEWSGDPYNGFGQSFTLRGARPDGALHVASFFSRQHYGPDDSAPIQLENLGVLVTWA